MDIKYHAIRSLSEEDITEMIYQPTRDMIVDTLRKHLPKLGFIKHRRNNLFSISSEIPIT